MKRLALSILSSKDQKRDIELSIKKNYDWIHYDVMDGKFVENTFLSITELDSLLEGLPKHIIDIHLMCANPILYIEKFIDKVDYLTIHHEISKENKDYIFKKYGHLKKIGIALNPDTDVNVILEYLPYVSHILVMSVYPGKSGQKFIEASLTKISLIREILLAKNLNTFIQVDGGVNDLWIEKIYIAGGNVLVSGTYLINQLSSK